ncbi:cytadherence high molecular weight protein 1 isoform X2 [Armigeres subalbatus]|uniref:cytadherence high molecular weight protein 1 isoform X2 n=1 Tax=Armigeres subalbatus TaxID=124917 RepID=UPI002ED407D8
MFSEKDINRHNYQMRFMEMENKIKRCELERAELEQRFAQLMRERQECEKTAARQVKMKYKRMMELEQQRAERNENLLRMLHTIDQQAASLAAKTDRLKMLKTQYESYLIRSWSSQRALPCSSPIPSQHSLQSQLCLAHPPTSSIQFPQRPIDSPKSEFVRYLSDITHVQTAVYNPIPPPTALSNYISQQQPSGHQQYTSPFLASAPSFVQEPIMRPAAAPEEMPAIQSFTKQSSSEPKVPATPRRLPSTVHPTKKLELSNEEFIQYIDNEILKGSSTVDSTEVTNDPPPDIVIDPPTMASTPLPAAAYLEDLTNDEEDRLCPPTGSRGVLSDDSPIIEEIVEPTAELNINDDNPTSSYEEEVEKSLAVSDDAIINQRWEKLVEVNSPIRPAQNVANESDTKVPLEELVAMTLRGVICEVEERYEVPPISDTTEIVKQEQPALDEGQYPHAYDLTNTSEAFGEIQSDYPQSAFDSENANPSEQQFPEFSKEYQDEIPPEYSVQDNVDLNYDNSSTYAQPILQTTTEDTSHRTTARQVVRPKSIETIDEVISNGEENPDESAPVSVSKHSSPIGENVTSTELHQSEQEIQPMQPNPEEENQQYDYSQYPQEYDPNDPNQQAAYYQQYTDDQTGQGQDQTYQEYADHDPNQYQQATEYPGPTQYVFEQGYYDEQQPQQEAESDQQQLQQQGYYEADPNATDQQYYAEEQADQAYYDQSQVGVEYPNYDEQVATAADASQEDLAESAPYQVTEDKNLVQQEHLTPTTVMSSEPNIEEKTSDSSELLVADEKTDSPVEPNGKQDTTISSANDESDFDFSTQ